MYPTVVVVLVETQCLMTDIYECPPPNASTRVGPVASGVRAAGSAMDKEAESPPSRALQSEHVQERGLEKVILEVEESRVSTIILDGEGSRVSTSSWKPGSDW